MRKTIRIVLILLSVLLLCAFSKADANDDLSITEDPTGDPNWWGAYANSENGVSLGIVNYNGSSFSFDFFLTGKDKPLRNGIASVDLNDLFSAEYMDIKFELHEDSQSIFIDIAKGSKWTNMRGYYELIDEPGDGIKLITVIFDKSCGSVEEDLQYDSTYASEDMVLEELVAVMSSWSGLDFNATINFWEDNIINVDWSADSTLIAGLDDREQKEEFFFYDSESLRWFMLDTMWRTLENELHMDVHYTMDGGKELVFDELYPVNTFPSELPYMGSAFYFAHADVRGDDDEIKYAPEG